MKRWDALFLGLLLISLFVRLYRLDYPLINGEPLRDYIVARHIVIYNEIPLTGPCCLWNSALGLIRNSPIYYYILSLPLLVRDDILFLNLVNIILQVGSIGIVYLLAKKLFSPSTALIAAALFSFSSEVLRQSLFVWQPHLMAPFVNASYLLLLLSYRKQSFTMLLLSVALLLFAGVLHNAAYGVVPAYGILTLFILRSQKRPLSYYFFTLAIAASFLLLLYLPYLFHLSKNSFASPLLYTTIGGFIPDSPSEFSKHLETVTTTLMRGFSIDTLLAVTFLIGLIFYIRSKRNPQKRRFFLLIILVIFQFIIASSLFKSSIWPYYFTPIFGLLAIGIAQLINSLLSTGVLRNALKVLLVLSLIKVFSFDFQFLRANPFLTNAKEIDAAAAVITREIKTIDPTSFRIKMYAKGIESPITSDLVFWAALEKKLSAKFLSVVDEGNSYKLLNSNTYLFIICQSHPQRIDIGSECLSPFFNEHRNYSLVKNVYVNKTFAIYSARKRG